MFADTEFSGKHMILDIKEIKNKGLLIDFSKMMEILDHLCNIHQFTVLQKVSHKFEPVGYTLLYLLSESHISIHTFPERDYIAFDIYTCRQYSSNQVYDEIHAYLVDILGAKYEAPRIIDRVF